jgi:uncharacterized protein (DUF305 family)
LSALIDLQGIPDPIDPFRKTFSGMNKMNFFKSTAVAGFLLAASTGNLLAQEHQGHDMSGMAPGQMQLPDICMTGGDHPMEEMSMKPEQMDEAHMALMEGMDEMNRQMMMGMMAEDVDVAFICGMIPHHQSAVNMAKAELDHGDNEDARAMAQKIIDSQEQEIAEMMSWLEEQAPAETEN